MLDILIKNGTVIDGTGKSGRKLDIGVEKGKITEISENLAKEKATKVLDATNRFVTPGFIDIQNHSDSYWTLFDQPGLDSLISQGITTIVIGNCGSSLAPLPSQEAIKTIQKWHSLSGINLNWSSFSEFLSVLKQQKLGLNVASLVGHATIRRGLLSDEVRKVKEDELLVMEKLLEAALAQGAFGLSMGLIYAHEVDSTFDELSRLAAKLKSTKKYLSAHLRSEGSHILEAVDEVIALASKTEVPLKISHLKIRGKKNWHLFDRLMSKLENAYHQGLDISFDVYPYDTSWSVLYTYLPKWAYEGGRAEILKRINSNPERRKILDYLKDQGHDFGSIVVATADNRSFIGKSIIQIAQNQNVSNEEALLNILAATQAQVVAFDHNLASEHVELLCSSPLSMIASDGAGYREKTPVENLVHPRCFGAIPRFLKMVRELKILTWEQAIKKITSEPARLLGLSGRGKIAANTLADIVIFDPLKVTDKADYSHPFQLSEGIDYVIVNGSIAFAGGKVIGFNGQVFS